MMSTLCMLSSVCYRHTQQPQAHAERAVLRIVIPALTSMHDNGHHAATLLVAVLQNAGRPLNWTRSRDTQ
jgi:hypothetical protein